MNSLRAAQPSTGAFKLLIHQAELNNLAGWVLEHPHDETGGDLFGFWTHSGSPTVQLVLGPGEKARHEAAAFYQDRNYLERAGRYVQQYHGLQHIGDWHSHHRLGLRTPSNGDVNTARRVFEYTEFPRFMLLIATIERDDTERSGWRQVIAQISGEWVVRVGAYLFERDVPHYRTGCWVVLPHASPLGESVRSARVAGRPGSPSSSWRVARTTLESSTETPRAPAAGWYTSAWGNAFLRTLDQKCRGRFEDCRMSLDPRVSELTYSFRAGDTAVTVGFPADYPAGPAVITARGTTQRSAPTVKDADALFDWIVHVLDGAREKNTNERPKDDINGMEPKPDRPPGDGANDTETLLPESPLAPSDRPNKDIS